jgi:transposase
MIPFGSSSRYYLHREPADMRKSFDGLAGLVRSGLGRDPLSGDVFVFLNRRRTHIKLLVWDRSGFVLYYKRLESGTFELPAGRDGELSWADLMLMLEGVALRSVRRLKRFALPEKSRRMVTDKAL